MKKNLNIFLIGAGGTGSWAFRSIVSSTAQYLKDNPLCFAKLHIIDRDIVEHKNCIRQAFTSVDVDKYKGQVLFERVCDILPENFQLYFYPFYVSYPDCPTPKEGSYEETYMDLRNTFSIDLQNSMSIFFVMVDNNNSRKGIHSAISELLNLDHEYYTIDAGNENNYGQVVCASSFKEEKTLFDYFPNLLILSEDLKVNPSCADFDLSLENREEEQTVSANYYAAKYSCYFYDRILSSNNRNKVPSQNIVYFSEMELRHNNIKHYGFRFSN